MGRKSKKRGDVCIYIAVDFAVQWKLHNIVKQLYSIFFFKKSYMEQCLRSVMAQTLKNIEIICVDAGSTDGTLEIIKQCAAEDSRIRLIESEVKSYGVQMNMGLKAARADYIGIIETDDFAAADMYETLYSIMKSSGVDVVKANNYRIDVTRDMPSENLEGLEYNKPIRPSEHKDLFFVMPSIWNGLYRKDFLKERCI